MDEFSKLDAVSRFAVQSVVKVTQLTSRFERRRISGIGEVYAYPSPRGICWGINAAPDYLNTARGVISR